MWKTPRRYCNCGSHAQLPDISRFECDQVRQHLAQLRKTGSPRCSITRNPDAAGAILETFVLGEIRRQNGWSSQRVDFFHYRDREGREIDLIADVGDGRVVAIEVKASSTPTAADTKHLRWLSERLRVNFVAGILLHTGPRAVPFATNIFALPIEVLWT